MFNWKTLNWPCCILFLAIFITLLSIGFNLRFYTWNQLMFALIPELVTILVLYTFYLDAFVATSFALTLVFYFLLRINQINSYLDQSSEKFFRNTQSSPISITKFIEEHCEFSREIKILDKFYGQLNFAFIFAMYPMSLIFLHLFLFEDIHLLSRIFYGFIIVIECVLLFGVQYFFASLSAKLHKSCKLLSKIQWTLNRRPSSLRLKLKLQAYFERLNSKKKIGISIASLTVMCYPLLSRVCSQIIINWLY